MLIVAIMIMTLASIWRGAGQGSWMKWCEAEVPSFALPLTYPNDEIGLSATMYKAPPRMLQKQHKAIFIDVLTTIIPGVFPVLQVPKKPCGLDFPSAANMVDSLRPGTRR